MSHFLFLLGITIISIITVAFALLYNEQIKSKDKQNRKLKELDVFEIKQ